MTAIVDTLICVPCSRGYHYACEVAGCEEECDPVVSTGDLVNTSGLAEHFGVSVQAVSNWAKRNPDFPPPVPCGTPGIYVLSAVVRWRNDRSWQQRKDPSK